MTPKTLISLAAAGAFVIGVGAAYAQNYDPSVRKEFDERSVAADIPIFWERDPAGKLVLDAEGNPILISPAPSATVVYVTPEAILSRQERAALVAPEVSASTVVVAPVDGSVVVAEPVDVVDVSLPPRLEIVANAPIPDTPANRARYGEPLSRAGRMTAPLGN